MCCFKFSVPLAHNGVLFAPILSVVHLLHQINRRWERLTLNESSSSFSCIWQLWTKAVGVDFGTWPALASFACRALVVGENSLLRGAADRPVKPQNTLWNACTATFSWQAASSALQSYLIRSSKASSQCFSSLLLLWHSSQAILSGWEQSTHRGFSPRRASTNRLLDRSLASLIRGKWLENCSPWKAKVILGHHTPGRCEPWQAIEDVCPLFSQGRDRPCRDLFADLYWESLCDRSGLSRDGKKGTCDNTWTWQLCGTAQSLSNSQLLCWVWGEHQSPGWSSLHLARPTLVTAPLLIPHHRWKPVTSCSCVFLRYLFWSCSAAKCTLYP